MLNRQNLIKSGLVLCALMIVFLIIGAKSCGKNSGNNTTSGSSNVNTFTINAPSNLNNIDSTYTSINLQWQDNSNNEDGFEIERSINYDSGWEILAVVAANATSYSDTTISPFTIYYYKVRALNSIGDRSEYSNTITTTPASFLSITAGLDHNIALARDGTMWGWGINDYYQLGLGNDSPVTVTMPTQIGTDTDWSLFSPSSGYPGSSGGGLFTVAIKINGTAWSWGDNRYGQLGLGDTYERSTPVQIGTGADWSVISAGSWRVMAVKTNGTAWSWGSNTYPYTGLLGLGDSINRKTPSQIGTGSDWNKVSTRIDDTVALKNNGTIWQWGNIPQQVGTDSDWTTVMCGSAFFAIKTNRTLWAWGYTGYGQLGNGQGSYGAGSNIYPPIQVGNNSDWLDVFSAQARTAALKIDGTIWTWGINDNGRLGLGFTALNSFKNTPTQIGTDSNWNSLTLGGRHTLASKINGQIWVWGENEAYQLALGDTMNRITPTLAEYAMAALPKLPLSLTAVISGTEINLSWIDASNNELGFIIERKSSINGVYTQIVTVGTDVTSWSDTGPFNGVYYYRIRSYNANGGSTYYSNETYPYLASPSGLTYTAVSPSQINLGWADNSDNETGFRVLRKESGDYIQISTLAENNISFADTTVTNANTYNYKILAYNNMAESAYSNVITATALPLAPNTLTATAISPYQIVLTWTDVTNETGFRIEQSLDDITYTEITTVGQNVITYLNGSGLSHSTTYYYKVRAYNSGGNSAYSPMASATTPLGPPNQSPILTVTAISSTRIDLAWTDISIEDGYKIERKFNQNGIYEQIATVGQGIITYSDITAAGFADKTCFYYRVKGYNSAGDGPYSNQSYTAFSGNWSAISSGDYNATALKSNNTIWVWGKNDDGQLGLGDTISRTVPTLFGSLSDWSYIDSGASYIIRIKTNGTIWGWGDNWSSQLGLGDGYGITPIQVVTDTDWEKIVTGDRFSVALKNNGSLWSWGNNTNGQLGLGDSSINRFTPAQIGIGSDWSDIAVGSAHVLGIKANGSLWSWGNNTIGQLGLGDTISKNMPYQVGTDSDWDIIAGGFNHTLAIKTNDIIWAWGDNEYGQLGLGDTIRRTTPAVIGTNPEWAKLTAGTKYSIALKTNGTIWSWGYNWSGQLGLGNSGSNNRLTPSQIGSNSAWINISAGNEHTIGLKTDNTLYSWGSNYYGQLGLGISGNGTNRITPSVIGTDSDWNSVAAGTNYSVALKSNKTTWGWGNNDNHQINESYNSNITSPAQANNNSDWLTVVAGINNVSAMKSDYSIWAWGAWQDSAYAGQLGREYSNMPDKNIPVQIGDDSEWNSIGCGKNYTLAIKTNLTMWGWGYNGNGQLGVGDIIPRNTPCQTGTNSDWSLVVGSWFHTVALKTNKTIWSWGYNTFGQLGLGNSGAGTDRYTPTQIGTNSDWSKITAGRDHVIALKTNKTLWGWGRNNYGQVGSGSTTTNKMTPLQISTSSDWISISAGNYHTLGLRSNYTLWVWGYNAQGQLGFGDTINRTSLTNLGTQSDWSLISAKSNFSGGIKSNGTLWDWGLNDNCQLGLGDTIGRKTPTLVGE